MVRKKVKQSYLTKSDCLKIIEYSNDLLDSLVDCIRYQNCENSFEFQRRYYNLESLFQSFVSSFSNEDEDNL